MNADRPTGFQVLKIVILSTVLMLIISACQNSQGTTPKRDFLNCKETYGVLLLAKVKAELRNSIINACSPLKLSG